jgi:hypothetical protein
MEYWNGGMMGFFKDGIFFYLFNQNDPCSLRGIKGTSLTRYRLIEHTE